MLQNIKYLIVTFFLLFSFNAFGNDIPISKKLWNIDFNNKTKKEIKNIFNNIEKNQHEKALKSSAKIQNSIFKEAFHAIIYRDQIEKFNIKEINLISQKYPFFNQKNINTIKEQYIMDNNMDYKEIKGHYSDYRQSKNKNFLIYLTDQKFRFYKENDFDQNLILLNIQDEIKNIWLNYDFLESEKDQFLKKYGEFLDNSDHISKIKSLFWQNKISKGRKLFNLISPEEEKLFLAILKIRKNPKDLRKILLSIPRKYRSDELLYYNKLQWAKKRKDEEKVLELLLKAPPQSSHPFKWWKLRKLYGRELLKDNKRSSYKKSYKIISNHGLKKGGSEYADAEWSAGWIALRFLNDANLAYEHFTNLYQNVNYPISISRAAYWLAEAAIEDNKKKAIYWYQTAMRYPTYFYAQIAYQKYRKLKYNESNTDLFLPEDPVFNDKNISNLKDNNALKTALLFAIDGQRENAKFLLKNLITKINDKGDIAVIVELLYEIGDNKLKYDILKYLSEKNIFFIKKQFQKIKYVTGENKALIHALIKQESGFSQSAVSSVGALGFMQLMPYTAKEVARKMKIKYSPYKLKKSAKYNIKLGSYYIGSLLKKFDNSKIMAIASYNAGPNAVKRWVKEFYDPREEQDINKIIDWIELITYSETRNYVQRIMENLVVYEYLFDK